MATSPSVILVPATRQQLWGAPAVMNFACGGLGAGLYVVAAVMARLAPSPLLTLASWVGPALVLAGFGAVAAEAGRPLRGARVFTRVATSWMAREVWLGGAFAALALADLASPSVLTRAGAVVAAGALVVAQGLIVRRARGVAAWDVPALPVAFLASSLVSGAGVAAVASVALGGAPGDGQLGGTMFLLVLAAVVWLGYLTWSGDAAFAATRPLREGRAAVGIVGGGYVVPFVLLGLGLALPALAPPAAALAGALMVGVQIRAKASLILTAGQLRPITVSQLRLQRRSS